MSILESSDGTLWTAEDRPCPICGSKAAKTLGARGGRAHKQGKGVETNVVRCKACKLIYTLPTLVPKSNPYRKESAEEYFQLHDFGYKVSQGRKIATFAEKVLGSPGRMLELGCGRGELLKGALECGWSAYGVDMTEEFTRVARSAGVIVECCSIQDCKSLEQTYDVILLAAILEHLYDPMEVLARIKSALRPGGLLFVDVPNESSLTMRVGNLYMRARRRNWAVNLSPTFSPFHVIGFSPTSLRNTLSTLGFEILALEVPKWRNALPPAATVGQKIERVGLSVVQYVGGLVGMGDGITCWAVRK